MAQITVVPDSVGPRYIALIDSVGGVDFVQFNIQQECELIILFVDHSSILFSREIDEARLQLHIYFAEQLVKANEKAPNRKSVLILINKSDLWGLNDGNVERLDDFGKQLKDLFQRSASYKDVQVIGSFSNNVQGEIGKALKAAAHLSASLKHV